MKMRVAVYLASVCPASTSRTASNASLEDLAPFKNGVNHEIRSFRDKGKLNVLDAVNGERNYSVLQ